MYAVYRTAWFEKRVRKELSQEQQRELLQMEKRLRMNPWMGDSLGPHWFREVRLREKRVYFLVKETVVLFIECSNKNEQQRIIDAVQGNIAVYEREIETLMRRDGRDLP